MAPKTAASSHFICASRKHLCGTYCSPRIPLVNAHIQSRPLWGGSHRQGGNGAEQLITHQCDRLASGTVSSSAHPQLTALPGPPTGHPKP